jgi:hypothetical protein
MITRGVRTYAVQMRTIGATLHTLEVEAEDAFMAHRAAKKLFPDRNIVKIALVPNYRDGEDW